MNSSGAYNMPITVAVSSLETFRNNKFQSSKHIHTHTHAPALARVVSEVFRTAVYDNIPTRIICNNIILNCIYDTLILVTESDNKMCFVHFIGVLYTAIKII